jgi:hypothetical protein
MKTASLFPLLVIVLVISFQVLTFFNKLLSKGFACKATILKKAILYQILNLGQYSL